MTLGKAKRNGTGWQCRCPVEDHKKSPRPLSIRDGDLADIVVNCFAGCSPIDVLRALRERRLLGDQRREYRPPQPRQPIVNSDKARCLFDKARPIKGTPAECYLRDARGCLILPPHEAVRFMPPQPPHFPWGSMVALVTDFTDANRVLTLHFTDLLPDGSGKAPTTPNKRTLKGYPTKGGAIRLTDDADVTTRLGVAEGIETALSLMTAFREAGSWAEHVWCALNAGNMADLPVLPGIEVLKIYADRGAAGEKAVDKLADRWLAAGRDVFVAVAPHDDWNPEVTT